MDDGESAATPSSAGKGGTADAANVAVSSAVAAVSSASSTDATALSSHSAVAVAVATSSDAPPPPADVVRAAADAYAAAFIGGFERGFSTLVGDGGRSLSGGQRQRVVLARALVRAPSFLLLDEATAALDNESERAVQESIDALLAEKAGAMTTLVVAHRLSTIRRADVIFVMDAGRIVERGTWDELLKAGGLFSRLAAAQGVRGGGEGADA